MPRKAREKSISGIYHVMLRGINKQPIFEEAWDYQYFLKLLYGLTHFEPKDNNTPKKNVCEIYAFVLMNNHVHLLIKPIDDPLGKVIQSIAGAYAYYFNHKYQRVGHLFQNRFRSEPVEDEEYLLTLMRYIHQNPVKAGMVIKPLDYPYSSWREYFYGKEPIICNTNFVLEKIPISELVDLVNKNVDQKDINLLQRKVPTPISDNKIWEILKTKYDITDGNEVAKKPKKERNAILMELIGRGAGQRQLQRMTGVDKTVIGRLSKKMEPREK